MELIPHLIGADRSTAGDRRGDIYDPATGKVQRQVPFAGPDLVDSAVAAAAEASPGWRATPVTKRTQVLFEARRLFDARREDIARVVAEEHGKVLDDARGEVARGLEVLEFACGLPHLLKGRFSEQVSSGVDTYSILQPLGVVAGITPFNFPIMVPLWMVPLAIGCGNTFVLKPSERDPSAAVLLAELFLEAGLPPGVLNVVHGDKVAVDRLLEHPLVSAVSSVGSTPVARHIYETAAASGKRVQALGGAKNHLVVMPDAHIPAAADAIVGAAFGSTGQRCMAISAVVAVAGAGDVLVDAVCERVRALRIGPAFDETAEMGPLVSAAARDKAAQSIETGLNEGATLVADGRSVAVEGHPEGFFLGPSVFDHVTEDMTIYRDEIFGPVLSVLRVPTLAAALEVIENNPYGNGAAIFTSSGAAARAFQERVASGMVGINVPIPVPLAFYSFGGWKSSLFGDLHVYGEDAVRFYTRQKVVTARWDAAAEGPVLGFPSS